MSRPVAFVFAPLLAAAALLAVGPSAALARGRRANLRTGRLLPSFATLLKAKRQGDRGALGRLGDRIGPARLAQAIAGSDNRVAEAALAAAPLARAGILLVGTIADQLASPEPARATAAATVLGVLLDGAVPSALEDWDVPPDLVARACGGLRALAARHGAAMAARLAALDAMLEAEPSCGAGGDLSELIHDPAPEIRRAAVLVAAGGGHATAVRDGLADADRTVRAAAAAAACRVEGRAGSRGKKTPPVAPAIAAARAMVTASATAPADAVEMLDCLAAADTPGDRALLNRLRQGGPSPLRDRAIELDELARAKGTE